MNFFARKNMLEFNINELERKANLGDSESAYFLGAYYKFQNNIQESQRWAESATEKNHPMASTLIEQLRTFEE